MGKRIIGAILLIALSGLLAWGTPAQAFQETPGPLAQMLGQVGDNPVSRTVMWYGSQADLERVLGIQLNSLGDFQKLPKNQQATYLMDIGKQVYYSPFSGTEQSAGWKKVFGVDPFAIERELTVGSEPNWYAILQGRFAADSIIPALTNLGYKAAQVGKATVYSLGADNASDLNNPASQLARNVYNRLVISDTQIVAAPSTALIRTATDNSKSIGDDPAYAALVSVLENPTTAPNTQLLSAALFSGSFLSQMITVDSQNANLLPRYDALGFGYRRNATDRFLVVALAYGNADTVDQAKTILADQLVSYGSPQQSGRKLFDGWKIDVTTRPSADNKWQVVTATMQLPAETDIAWIDLVQNRDIGFLAMQR
jgi:hypothetical protein